MVVERRKIIKWSLFFVGGLIVFLWLVLSIAGWYVNAHKATILRQVTEKIQEETRGEVKVRGLSLSVWRDFPLLRVGVADISVSDSVYHRPLFSFKEVTTKINLFKVLFGKLKINYIRVADGRFHLFTDANGYSNGYILEAKNKSPQKTDQPTNLNINTIRISNVRAILEDRVKDKYFSVDVHELNADISKPDSNYAVRLYTDLLVNGLGFNLQKGFFLKNKTLSASWKNMQFNPRSHALQFDVTPVSIADHVFNIGGGFVFSKDSATSRLNLTINSKATTFKDCSSILANNIQKTLNKVVWTGPIDVAAHLEGSLMQSTPEIHVQASALNSQLSLPGTLQLDSCYFVGAYHNQIDPKQLPDDRNSVIDLAGFKANWNGIPLVGKQVKVTNLITPRIDLALVSDCSLPALNDQLDIKSISLQDGTAQLSLNFHGSLVSVKDVIGHLTGSMDLRNGKVVYLPRNFTFSNCNGKVLFSGNDLIVQNLQTSLNGNHITVNIAGSNVGKVALENGQKGKIVCSVYSPSINLGLFRNLFATVAAGRPAAKKKAESGGLADSVLQIDNLLENGEVQVNLRADKVKYLNFVATKLLGALSFQNNRWDLQHLSLYHADGTMALNGTVQPLPDGNNRVSLVEDIRNVNINKLFYAFDNFGVAGISYKNLRGIFSSTGKVSILIDPKGDIVKRSSVGQINFSLSKGRLVDFKPLLSIQKYVFKDRNLSNVEFANINNQLYLRNGDIFIRRMEIASTVLRLFVEGIYSPMGNSDISIQVPYSSLLKKQKKQQALHKDGKSNDPGASIYLRATNTNGGPIGVKLDLFKKFRKDKIGERFKSEFGGNGN